MPLQMVSGLRAFVVTARPKAAAVGDCFGAMPLAMTYSVTARQKAAAVGDCFGAMPLAMTSSWRSRHGERSEAISSEAKPSLGYTL